MRIKQYFRRSFAKLRTYASPERSVEIHGHRILFALHSPVDLHRLNTYETKEPETVSWIASFDNTEPFTYFDVGANIGLFSLLPAVLFKDSIKIFSFEPMSQNYSSLSRNIYLNNLSHVIKGYCCAITSSQGFNDLHIPFNRFSSSGNRAQFVASPVEAEKLAEKPIIHTEGTYGTTIDSLVFQHNFPIPNYLKIDVDGLEQDVLKGAQETLCQEAVRSVLVEVRPNDKGQQDWVCAQLKSAGLILRSRSKRSRGAPNFIFFRK